MTVINATLTPFLKIPVPGEDSDPFYDQFLDYTAVLENALFYSILKQDMFLSGGGTRIWSPSTNILTWTAPWIIPVPHWGYAINVNFGPDNATMAALIPLGSSLLINFPISLSQNINVNFQVASQLNTNVRNQWTCAMNVNGTLALRGIGELS